MSLIESQIVNSLVARFYQERILEGCSQDQIARDLGISRMALYRYRRDGRINGPD